MTPRIAGSSVLSAATRDADPLPETASLLLDVLRFGLCLAVVVGHISEGWFNTNWPNLMVWANSAVPGFFVLSGFVIRYVTTTRERDARGYFVSRASRIYSVVLPAIALTVVLDAVARHVDPVFYRSVFRPTPWGEVPLRIGLNLLFLTQSWGHAVLMLSNTPLWSLGYEVPYYVLFGVALYRRGVSRAILLVLCGMVFGPQVLLLLPIWWSGIWLYDLWQWFRSPRRTIRARCAVVSAAMAALLLLWLPVDGVSGFDRVGRWPNPLFLLRQFPVRASMYEISAGLLSFAALLLLLCATDLVRLPKQTRAARAVRFAAEGTFTLYLFHFPLLMFAGALHLFQPDRTLDKVLVLVVIVVLCTAAAVPIDGFKRWLRDRMRVRRTARTQTYS